MNFSMYLITVIGFFSLMMMSMSFFIYYLRVGLDTRSSRVIDPMPPSAPAEEVSSHT